MPQNIFYFFFWPQTALNQWGGYMLSGILGAAILILAGCGLYAVLPYNRDKEPLKFFSVIAGVLLISLLYALWLSSTIPDEIARDNYKTLFVLNHVVSTLIWEIAAFYLLSGAMGPKKHFARIGEYIFK